MTINENYLKNHLIAYIGNKRNLLDLIKKSIEKTGVLEKDNISFLDLFAGSGSVSRLAKSLGFKVIINDWEYYSYIINKAFVGLNAGFLKSAFRSLGGINKVLEILNNLSDAKEEDQYIEKYYCPADDDEPDTENERMFYTRYNGKKIDAIRGRIEEWANQCVITEDEEYLLLALLLYEASTRSNTSGVFKGFHKGFGGTNGDALGRILKPIELIKPALINGRESIISREDAVKLSEKLKNEKIDIAYLDPPYNQHQYGSNYHLLNTIALNDKPTVNKNIFINGKKMNKSAIRRDWTNTKSSFCCKKNAIDDFKKIIENLNADHILISYSTDGIIEFDRMLKILSKKGQLDICLSEYVKYRGGKQALTTQVKNIEFVLIVNTKERGSEEDIIRIKKILMLNKINIFVQKTINPIRAEEVGFDFLNDQTTDISGEKLLKKKYNNKNVVFRVYNNKIIDKNFCEKEFYNLSIDILERLHKDLEYITNLTKEDEIYLAIGEIFKYYKLNMNKKVMDIFKDIPYCLSKFNNKKNYINSLKSISAVLDMMIQTIDLWKKNNIIDDSSFNKLEKTILIKLNYNELLNYKKNIWDDVKEKFIKSELATIKTLKNKINTLYEYLINSLEDARVKDEKKDVKLVIKKKYYDYTRNISEKISTTISSHRYN